MGMGQGVGVRLHAHRSLPSIPTSEHTSLYVYAQGHSRVVDSVSLSRRHSPVFFSRLGLFASAAPFARRHTPSPAPSPPVHHGFSVSPPVSRRGVPRKRSFSKRSWISWTMGARAFCVTVRLMSSRLMGGGERSLQDCAPDVVQRHLYRLLILGPIVPSSLGPSFCHFLLPIVGNAIVSH